MLRHLAVSAALATASLPVFSATPASGTITPTSAPIVFTSGPFPASNATPVPLLDSGPTCDDPAPACDSFELTVSIPTGYIATHGADSVKVTTAWTDTGSGNSDYDLWIYSGQVATTDGGMTPPYSGDGGANPEVANLFPLADGDNIFTIKIVPYTSTGETVTTTIEYVSGTPGPVIFTPGFGGPDAASPGVARYQNFDPPEGFPAEASSGECNIGFNPLSSKIMFMCFGNGSVFRLTTPENLATPLPEACPAGWEDATPLATSGPQPVADPILFTDNVSGRTWASNLTAGPNISYAFTDDDGATWVEAGTGGVAGADHQTIGSGPYPAGFALPHPLHENAVYFCSQFILGPAGCIRSDDGGVTWGPTYLAYDGSVCSGLHGHVRVSPKDGSVWLPAETCGTGTGMAVSEDAGETWRDFAVPSTEGRGTLGADPTVSLDADGKAYFCYADGDGHIRASVSADNGRTWTNETDLGSGHGIINSTFPQSWAGSSGRAACAFMGTDRQGNIQSIDFPGLWYMYVAHTYDGGLTWTTRIVTPNDPVQGVGGVWHGGGSNANRNLLDFNEATGDSKGRFIVGYDDGCVRDCARAPLDNPQSFTAMMKVLRQSGGKTLLASEDRPEPHAPNNACLSQGARDQFRATLGWIAPDNGGAEISNYRVFRATSPGGPFVFVGDAGAKTQYVDNTVDENIEKYYYNIVAVNASGESVASNQIELPIVVSVIENSCVLPGLTVLTSPDGLTGNGLPTGQDDLRQAWIAEPESLPGKLVITLKVETLSPQPPPNYRWIMYFRVPGDTREFFAAMDTTQAAPRFIYGTRSATETPAAAVGTFTVLGTLDAASSFGADGTIGLVIDKASFAAPISNGMLLTGIAASIRQTSNPENGAGLTVDSADAANYTVVGNACQTAVFNPGMPVPVPVPVTPVNDDGRFGTGAFGLALLLPLLGAGLRRRRN